MYGMYHGETGRDDDDAFVLLVGATAVLSDDGRLKLNVGQTITLDASKQPFDADTGNVFGDQA
jgi:hypothetical protein